MVRHGDKVAFHRFHPIEWNTHGASLANIDQRGPVPGLRPPRSGSKSVHVLLACEPERGSRDSYDLLSPPADIEQCDLRRATKEMLSVIERLREPVRWGLTVGRSFRDDDGAT